MEKDNPWIQNSAESATRPQKTAQTPATEQGIDRLAAAAESFVKQERWSKRWTNVLKIMVVLYILVAIVMFAGFFSKSADKGVALEHAAIIKINGSIMPNSRTSAESINPLLREAFEAPNAKAVVLYMNSPGGSPVQSALINNEIHRLKQIHQKPVYVVTEDLCASGCYYIAVAADQIFANQGSIIGSIGVRFDSFGFTGLMDKIGIENRSMTAGEYKSFINPFGEEDKQAKQFFKEHILERTHQQFIEAVREGRGNRLQEHNELFNGLVWLGDEAVELGLIDGLGDLGYVTRDVIGVTRLRHYEQDKSLMEHFLGDLVSETALKLSEYIISLR